MQGIQVGRLHSDDLSAPWALRIPVQQLLIGGEEAVPPAVQATGTGLLHASNMQDLMLGGHYYIDSMLCECVLPLHTHG